MDKTSWTEQYILHALIWRPHNIHDPCKQYRLKFVASEVGLLSLYGILSVGETIVISG